MKSFTRPRKIGKRSCARRSPARAAVLPHAKCERNNHSRLPPIGNSGATALPPGFQHRDVRSRRGESVSRRGEQSALDLLDRRRHGFVFERPALHRVGLAAAEGRGAGRGDDQLLHLRLSAAGRRQAVLDQSRCHRAVRGTPSHRLVRIGLKGREIANEKRPASNLVFLLDVSGSMMPAERLPLVKQAMRLLVDKLTENDRVAIVVYAGGSGLALPSTTGDHKEQILSRARRFAGRRLDQRRAKESSSPTKRRRTISSKAE